MSLILNSLRRRRATDGSQSMSVGQPFKAEAVLATLAYSPDQRRPVSRAAVLIAAGAMLAALALWL
jgi:hypothetical protein